MKSPGGHDEVDAKIEAVRTEMRDGLALFMDEIRELRLQNTIVPDSASPRRHERRSSQSARSEHRESAPQPLTSGELGNIHTGYLPPNSQYMNTAVNSDLMVNTMMAGTSNAAVSRQIPRFGNFMQNEVILGYNDGYGHGCGSLGFNQGGLGAGVVQQTSLRPQASPFRPVTINPPPPNKILTKKTRRHQTK